MRPALLLLCLVPACFPTEFKPATCTTDPDCTAIGAGLRCDLGKKVCVCASAAYPGCEKFIDAGTDAVVPSDLPAPPDVFVPPDGPAEPDSPPDMPIVDAPVDLFVPDRPVDTYVPDAVGTCGVNNDCPNPAKSFCVAGVCAGCSASLCASRVDGGASVCATTGTLAGQCVECVADGECSKNPAKGFCVNNACAGCNAALCGGRIDAGSSLVCATTGTAAGQCVECVADAQCTRDPAKGFCVANACTGCTAAICGARTDGKSVCAASGTAAGQCVECAADAQCTANPAKSFCVANACTGCTAAICGVRTDGKTTCAATGAFTGQCVVCTTNVQCSGTKPICATATETCRACTTDIECSAIGPGVCMTDGHCATDNETIYVGTAATTACSDTTGMGGPSTPVCSAAYGISLAKTGSKSVVLVRGALTPPSPGSTTTIAVPAPLTIVGKNNAIIAPATGADALLITSGDITLRNLTIQGNAAPATGIGISAAPAPGSTVTLHMDTCVIANNPGGGILLNGAAFDIKNTTVTGNGPNTTTGWGGISVQNAPASGPTTFNLVSIKDNGQIGLTCAGSIASTDTGTGVLATGNVGGIQITSICGITACTPASTTCGAQSTPQ